MTLDIYETPAGNDILYPFLNGLPSKCSTKILHDIDLLMEFGTELREPHTKHVDGPLWELRSKFSSNNYRIFYSIFPKDNIVVLHAFEKRTQRTPKSEIIIARQRYDDYVVRHGQPV